MPFRNQVVAGTSLVRDSIHSPNYVAGTSGWTINKDGSAEFNNVTVRGGFEIGTSPSPPNPYIRGEVLAGIPTISIYDGVHSRPATIEGYDLGGDGGLVLNTGDTATESAGLAMGGSIAEMIYDHPGAAPFENALVHVGPPGNQIIKLRATSASSQDLEFGFNLTGATPDGIGGRMYTYGEIKMNDLAGDSNYANRVADGKAPGTITATAINTTDTNIATANIVNAYVEDGYMYRCTIHIDYANANAGGRLEFKLWDGTVGASNQLGGTQRRWTIVATSTSYGGTVLVFMWRQVGTGIIANMNLSALKSVVTAGVANVQVNGAFSAILEKCGDANKIGGL